MKLKRNIIAGILAAGALTIGAIAGAAPASATTSYPEGGTWNYGPGYSNYLHPAKLHRSTSCNGTGACSRSGDYRGGYWANSSIATTAGGNTAYYYNY